MAKAKRLQDSMPEMKPTVYLSKKDLPEIEDWEVGKKYKLVMEVEMVSRNENEYDNKKDLNASFEIEKVKAKNLPDDFEKGLDTDGYHKPKD